MSDAKAFQFKVGDTHTSGETIVFIFGHSTEVIVFRDGKGRVQWETNSDLLTRTQSLVHQLYDRLHARVLNCISDQTKTKQLTDELAQALFLGLSDADEAKALKYFDNVAGRITHEAQIEARFTYLVTGSISAGVLLAMALPAAYWSSGNVRDVVAGAASGSVGAWASILSRASRLELGPFETPANLRFQGLTRILLGMVFGVITIVAMKTGQLFPSGSADPWITTLTTFVSGWSERLVPEIISKIETRYAKAAANSTTT